MVVQDMAAGERGKAYHGVALVGGDARLLFVGGYDGSDFYNNVRWFCVCGWSIAAPMYVPRCYVGVALLNDKVRFALVLREYRIGSEHDLRNMR